MIPIDAELKFLEAFPKDQNGLYIVYDLFTFDNLFRLLVKADLEHEEALSLILARCALSAIVFQERIHNRRYRSLMAQDAVPVEIAASRAHLIHHMMILAKRSS
jgi:hypothetical protein